jgi:hypothetical protein
MDENRNSIVMRREVFRDSNTPKFGASVFGNRQIDTQSQTKMRVNGKFGAQTKINIEYAKPARVIKGKISAKMMNIKSGFES